MQEMRTALNINLPKGEAVGQRAIAEDTDWKLYTLMMNWSVTEPWKGTWTTRSRGRTKARQRLDYMPSKGDMQHSTYGLMAADSVAGVGT